MTRPTRLAELVIRFNTVSQARFYIEHQGADFADYLREDDLIIRALSAAEEVARWESLRIANRGPRLPAKFRLRTG